MDVIQQIEEGKLLIEKSEYEELLRIKHSYDNLVNKIKEGLEFGDKLVGGKNE